MARCGAACLTIALFLLPASTTSAQPVPDTSAEPQADAADKPWAKGVTAEQRAKAEALLAQGNDQFVASEYAEALATYRLAIAIYDHPVIHFNIARTLINLDRPVGAYDSIQESLRYGPAALKSLAQEARNYRRLLRSQIGELEITCTQTAAVVTVDGKEFLTCPGTRKIRVAPGQHQIVAKKAGHLTLTQDLSVDSGASRTVEVELLSIADATVTERRWARWKPWAVVGGGLALGGIGLMLELQGQSSRDQYRDVLASVCSDEPCTDDELPESLWTRAQIEHTAGVSTMVAGGAMLVTGLALVILNRPRDVLPDQAQQPDGPRVVPSVSPGGVGASVVGRF